MLGMTYICVVSIPFIFVIFQNQLKLLSNQTTNSQSHFLRTDNFLSETEQLRSSCMPTEKGNIMWKINAKLFLACPGRHVLCLGLRWTRILEVHHVSYVGVEVWVYCIVLKVVRGRENRFICLLVPNNTHSCHQINFN